MPPLVDQNKKLEQLNRTLVRLTKSFQHLQRAGVSATDQRYIELERKVAKSTKAFEKQREIVSALASDRMSSSFRSIAVSAGIAGAAIGAVLKSTAALYDPAGSIRFQYRLRDLGATVGYVLHPAFESLSDSVKSFADRMYGMDPVARSVLNTFAKLAIPATVATLGIAGLGTALMRTKDVGVAAYDAIGAAALRYRTANPGGFNLKNIGTSALTLAKWGLPVAAGVGVGVATGSQTLGMGAGGAGLGMLLGGGPLSPLGWLGAAIGGLGGLAAGGLMSKFGLSADSPRRDSAGLSPQPAQTLTSGMQAARMFREASLQYSGPSGQAELRERALERNTKALDDLRRQMGGLEGQRRVAGADMGPNRQQFQFIPGNAAGLR